VAFKIQLRRGTAAQWAAANPILAAGEVGFITDENALKVGDGTTAWNSLDYSGSFIAPDSVTTNKIEDNAVTSDKLAAGAAAANLGFTPASTGKSIAMSIVFGGG
jgi:hypothetical protein